MKLYISLIVIGASLYLIENQFAQVLVWNTQVQSCARAYNACKDSIIGKYPNKDYVCVIIELECLRK